MQTQGRSSSSMPLILGIGGAGLLLACCCGGGAAYFLFEKRTEDRASLAVAERQGEEARLEAERRELEGSGPQVAPDPLVAPGNSLTITMTVDTTTGSLPGVAPGTVCAFLVTHRDDQGGLDCQAHVTCAGIELYGDTDTNGFFPCPSWSTASPTVVGSDTQMTGADSDPSFLIDSTTGTIIIADDASGAHGAFNVTGHFTAH